jgi:SpoVK/Ycf46/Vps4 family AAA+-type ATPase
MTYQPCVIFAEDIDRAAQDRDEDEGVNDLVNMLDGMISKDKEIMVILTTNFVDKIDTALLRPGRLDAVISIQPPDPDTVKRLIRAYARGLLPATVSVDKCADLLAGQIPATIREVVERAKLSMLTDDRTELKGDDLYVQAVGMKRHMALLEPKTEEVTAEKMLANGLIGVLSGAGDASGKELDEKLYETRQYLGRIISHTGSSLMRTLEDTNEYAKSASTMATDAATKAKEAGHHAQIATLEAKKVKRDTEKLIELHD